MNGEDFFAPMLVGFVLCALSGAIMGAAIVGLVWWLT